MFVVAVCGAAAAERRWRCDGAPVLWKLATVFSINSFVEDSTIEAFY